MRDCNKGFLLNTSVKEPFEILLIKKVYMYMQLSVGYESKCLLFV